MNYYDLSVDELCEKAEVCRNGGLYSRAIYLLNDAMQIDPFNEQVYQSIIVIKYESDDFYGVVDDCGLKIAEYSDDYFYYCYRGIAYLGLKKRRLAYRDLSEAVCMGDSMSSIILHDNFLGR